MKITDKDRELAAELVELLTDGAGDDRTVKCVAVILAAYRSDAFGAQGRCGRANPRVTKDTPVLHCDLPDGHGGWHKSGDGVSGIATEWSA